MVSLLFFALTEPSGRLRLIDDVHLADLEEVVDEERVGTQQAAHASTNKLVLLNIPAVELKLKLLVEAILNGFDIFQVTETQMVDFVTEVQMNASHEEHLNGFRVVVHADMEVSWNFVDEHGTAQLAALMIVETFDGLVEDFLGRLPAIFRVLVRFRHLLFGINLSVALIVNVLNNADFSTVAVQPMLVQLTLNVNDMHAGHVDNVETENLAWHPRQRNVHVDVKLLFTGRDINHDVTRLVVLQEIVRGSTEQQSNDGDENDGDGRTGQCGFTETVWQILVEVAGLEAGDAAIIFSPIVLFDGSHIFYLSILLLIYY